MCHVWESSKLVGFILTIMFINATLIITMLNASLEEPDSLMSKLFTSTWANFVKEVMIVMERMRMKIVTMMMITL